MSRFTEAEYGDMMQDLITRLRDQTIVGSAYRSYDPGDYSNLIDLVSAARVAIAYIEQREFGPEEYKPRQCPTGDCEGGIGCIHLSLESQAAIVEWLDNREEQLANDRADGLTICKFCGEDMGHSNFPAHVYKYHPDMRLGGPRVWSTVWHAPRDI